jgi:hypothetical protein
MSNIFKDLREQMSAQQVRDTLYNLYGISPTYDKTAEGVKYMIYKTYCHHLEGGSPKLYYYVDTHMFRCFTDCCAWFDIFELIIKMEDLRGRKITKAEAIEKAGFHISHEQEKAVESSTLSDDLSTLYEINGTEACNINNLKLEPIDIDFLDERFTFDTEALQTWVHEGISLFTMLKYRITYDSVNNCIVIPQYDANGKVVGVRGRFFNPDAEAKYMPITYNNKVLRHPTGKTLYGFYQNKAAMSLTHTAIIFEAEKSVMMMDTAYGDKNISVATCGQGVTREQIQLLLSIGVNRIVLAYDADYQPGSDQMNVIYTKYLKYATPLKTFFEVSIVFDTKRRLGYKDSPIDRGPLIFTELMKERIHI